MNDFRFAQSEYGNLLWLILLLAIVLAWLELRSRSALDRFLSLAMQSRLVHAASLVRRLLALGCLVLGLTALVFAAMRPQWGAAQRMLPRAGAQIMVCLDVSKSMLAEDTVPNRLERAKAEISDLLDLMQGEQVGLIAFAGKATIISPMTTDFGFLKLMMENVGVHSVGRGGTRLEEPIRKAVDGFGEAADISRVILLITDGEDHDSFPLDAAEAARERGIKIITIGFGDEAGSKIEISDRRTGARTFVTDRDGAAVISRLDGATLRDIALKTEGAYIPAGTGALDLVSIHQQHIAPLVRGSLESGQQIIRNEAFQWVVLVGLLLILLSVAISRGVSSNAATTGAFPATSKSIAAAVVAMGLLIVLPESIDAQPPVEQPITTSPDTEPADDDSLDVTSTDSDNSADEEVESRDAYNRALPLLASNVDAAESLLQQARRNAGTDGEVRYRSAYNLGWLEVQRADQRLDEEPPQALVHLRSAADWFRQAIRIRPKETDARHNLEIVMRRALELADSLAQKEQDNVANRLDRLITQQREFVGQAGQLVERLAVDNAPSPDDEIFRRDFRSLATTGRQILSDAQALALAVGEEQAVLAQKSQPAKADEPGLSDEERLRAGQLLAVNNYLQRAIQRMGQSRSQLRRKQDQRAFRRAAMGLSELKRARDMLRPPHEILKMLVNETRSLQQQTGNLAAAASSLANTTSKPSWLTRDYLQESQLALTERTQEWLDQMRAAVGNASPLGPPKPDSESEQAQMETHLAAANLVERAAESFASANASLESGNFDSALDSQDDAYIALTDALELYLDLKGLIETTYATEKRVEQVLRNVDQIPPERRESVFAAVAELQAKNLNRADRLERKLDREREQLEQSTQPQPAGPPASGTVRDPEEGTQPAARQRLEVAHTLLDQARTEMQVVKERLQRKQRAREDSPITTDEDDAQESQVGEATDEAEESSETDRNDNTQRLTEDPTDDVPASGPEPSTNAAARELLNRATNATQRLQDLRRLFYTVVEHLQETAQRQSEVNDATQELSGETDPVAQQEKLGPMSGEQQQLSQLAERIAEALQEQSAATPPPSAQPGSDSQPPMADQQQAIAEQSQQLREAAQLVQAASEKMQTSMERMQTDPLPLKDLRQSQDESLTKLEEALALLRPPQQQNNDQDQNEQQDQQDQQQQPEQQPEQQQQQENLSMNQLLQMIRDRDAQRRREKEKQQSASTIPVEKDW